MSIGAVSSTTALWVKDVSTNIILRMKRNILETNFIQRNKKKCAICLLVWSLVTVTAYVIYQTQIDRLKNDFYQTRVLTTQRLTERISTPLLEKDLLTLNIAIGELKNTQGLIYAAIVNHENTIVAHSNTKLINQPFRPLQKGKKITTVGKLAIQEEILPTNQKVINFSYNVTYAKVLIGKIFLAFSSSQFDKSSKRYQNFLIASVILSFLLLFMVVAIDRKYSFKALRVQRGGESSTEIGSYKLREKIAAGGMAEVYVADYIREDGFRKTVAIKRILPHIANNVEFIKMFIQEARLAALLQHPNIVQIYDFGKLKNDYYIAMEYIRGRNLAQIMSALKNGMNIEQTVFIISRVCMGLQFSHHKRDEHTGKMLNIVHRDISPQNILISFEGEVKITDFGICKAECQPSLTKAGTIKGKVCYLSPEQALGQTVDNQTDVYALGIVFYEMISGKRLYQFRSEIEAIRSIPEKEIAPLKMLRPEITDELNTIVMKCLEKNKRKRYLSAQELHNDLIRFKQRLSITYDTSDLAYFMKRYFREEQKVVDG